jgi:hypothetical protein
MKPQDNKTPLHYFKEIEAVSKVSFELAVSSEDNAITRSTYKTGDGDYIQPPRPGSLDYKKCKSRGLLSSTSF